MKKYHQIKRNLTRFLKRTIHFHLFELEHLIELEHLPKHLIRDLFGARTLT